jgi:hypothetical protein
MSVTPSSLACTKAASKGASLRPGEQVREVLVGPSVHLAHRPHHAVDRRDIPPGPFQQEGAAASADRMYVQIRLRAGPDRVEVVRHERCLKCRGHDDGAIAMTSRLSSPAPQPASRAALAAMMRGKQKSSSPRSDRLIRRSRSVANREGIVHRPSGNHAPRGRAAFGLGPLR